jgi:hypothetical protein
MSHKMEGSHTTEHNNTARACNRDATDAEASAKQQIHNQNANSKIELQQHSNTTTTQEGLGSGAAGCHRGPYELL